MIQDPKLQQAVSQIVQRAERQTDPEKILASFVDVGVLPQLVNRNHQIIYGRRGTGKTHVLRVLSATLENMSQKNTVLYIDARAMGSTSQFSDPSVPIKHRCTALFRDLLLPIYAHLQAYIYANPSPEFQIACNNLAIFSDAVVKPFKLYYENEFTTSESKSSESSGTGNLEVGLPAQGKVGILRSSTDSNSIQSTTTYRVESDERVVFPEIFDSLTRTLKSADVHLYVLIDEWSSLPPDLQPLLAEFLRRSLLPVQALTVKIASLEYRSRFSASMGPTNIGFELGADISVALDLDDYFVYDRNPNQLNEVYKNILYRHVQIELPDEYLFRAYQIASGSDFQQQMFTNVATFQELARASEGVIRDLINIFSQAFFDSQRRKRDTIDRPSVTGAAQKWFEVDKLNGGIDEKLIYVLGKIIENVIGTRRARSFLVRRELERHSVIQKLFDARVIHCVQRGYADKDNPGIRYNVYTLDYGTYVGLMNTSKAVQESLFDLFEEPTDNFKGSYVPQDDKRSIRRIILDARFLDSMELSIKQTSE